MNCGREGPMRPQIPKGIIFGIILIGLGAAFLLHNLYYIYIEDVLIYWPCALIVAGLVRIWNRGFFSIWGQILLMGGALLQLAQLQIHYGSFHFRFIEMWWPVVMIWVGLLITVKAFLPKKSCRRDKEQQYARDEWPMHEDEGGEGGTGAVSISSGSESDAANDNNNYGNYN
ncbi:MAG: DUF5668 domain-containing protein [Holophagales bacterium]|jgi:hypothetical protein|nr:DUF5668 domain-containing protein [Holophagales bacterium]